MIRFLLDPLSMGILVLTSHAAERVSFYYIADFLELKPDEQGEYPCSVQDAFRELLNHWKQLLLQYSNETFLLYDFDDQHVSAFYVEKYDFKGRLYTKISRKHSTEWIGPTVTKSLTLAELKSKSWFDDDPLPGNRTSLLKGIEWSLENLRINSNPVNI